MLKITKIENEFKRIANNTKNNLIELRRTLLSAFKHGLTEVDPERLINDCIKIANDSIIFRGMNNNQKQKVEFLLNDFDKILIIGGGKATAPMANACIKILGKYIGCYGSINIPHGQKWGNSLEYQIDNLKSRVNINYAAHPIPDINGVKGVQNIIKFVEQCPDRTLIITLISGGGSALMPLPKDGLDLSDLQKTNTLLLESGASINEINSVRKHLSAFKGGNLAKHIYPKKSVTLIISDVIHDLLDVIASGPTVPDVSTFAIAQSSLKKYNLYEKIPKNVKKIIEDGIKGNISETPKNDDRIFSTITNLIIGSAENAKMAIMEYLNKNSYSFLNYNDFQLPIMKGEAKEFGKNFLHLLKKIEEMYSEVKKNRGSKVYLISSGEFTVTLQGNGKGGRNQEMLLGLLKLIKDNNFNFSKGNFAIISMAFDGIEGNSNAAGAIIDNNTIDRINKLNINIDKFLNNNDSYSFFKGIEDSIEIGQTQTNTNDISAIIIDLN